MHHTSGLERLDEREVRRRARVVRDLVEPIAASVYFLAEAQNEYARLGLPDWHASYFASRGGCMGRVPGQLVVAAFGVFDPRLVIPAVDRAWAVTDDKSLLAARERGAVGGLQRVFTDHLGTAEPRSVARATQILQQSTEHVGCEGRLLYAGLRSLGFPGTLIGDLWRAADLVREHRGDCHITAWVGAGLNPIEAQLFMELWWRMPYSSYTVSRGWPQDEIDATLARLREVGLIAADAFAFTAAGEALRAEIELATDRQQWPVIEAIGDDFTELVALLRPLKDAVITARAYPVDPASLTRP